MHEISTVDELKQWIEASKQKPVFFFKHSTRCPVSALALDQFQQFEEESPSTQCVYIDLIQYREVSNTLEELSGIKHESPQVIFYVDGQPRWNASHHNITFESLNAQNS